MSRDKNEFQKVPLSYGKDLLEGLSLKATVDTTGPASKYELGRSRHRTILFDHGYRLAVEGSELSLTECPESATGIGSVTLFQLPRLRKTHILNVSSMTEFLGAYFLGAFPYSLYKRDESPQRPDGTVNEDLLAAKLNALEDKSYAKFFAFERGLFDFHGHSMLIKKTGPDKFSFFDPNHGETQDLSVKDIAEKMNEAMKAHGASQMALLDVGGKRSY